MCMPFCVFVRFYLHYEVLTDVAQLEQINKYTKCFNSYVKVQKVFCEG